MTINLDDEHAALLESLVQQAGVDQSTVINSALDLLAEAVLFDEDQPPLAPEEIAAIEEGLAAVERGDVVSHEQVFERIRAKFG